MTPEGEQPRRPPTDRSAIEPALATAALVALSAVVVLAPTLGGTLLFAVAGAVAGAVARAVLARMRRGARVRAPVCEVALAVVWAATGAVWLAGVLPGVWVPVLLGLGWLVVAGSVVDVLHHRLPDALTVPALPAAVLLVLPLGPDALGRAVAGAAVALVAHAGVRLVAPRALGGGDVKLAGSLGAVLAASSWPAMGLAAGLAVVLSGVVAVALLAGGRTGRAGAVPHGPSMLLSTWLVVAGAAVVAGAG